MPTYIFGDSDNLSFEPISEGDYPFEIESAEEAIQNGGRTSGSDILKLKVVIYQDDTFKTMLAKWTETLIFHESCFWKIDCFVKCTGYPAPDKGEELSMPASAMTGLRGWCKVGLKPGVRDPNRHFNHVALWFTDKPKIKAVRLTAADMPAPKAPSVKGADEDDDVAW